MVSYDPLDFLYSLGHNEPKSQELYNAIFNSQTWKDADRGILTLPEQLAIYKNQLPHYSADIDEIMEKWIYMPTMMEESEALLKEVLDLGYNVLSSFKLSRNWLSTVQTTLFDLRSSPVVMLFLIKRNY